MKKAGKPRHHQSHDVGIKQVNRDIIGVALNELRLFNLWVHQFKPDHFSEMVPLIRFFPN